MPEAAPGYSRLFNNIAMFSWKVSWRVSLIYTGLVILWITCNHVFVEQRWNTPQHIALWSGSVTPAVGVLSMMPHLKPQRRAENATHGKEGRDTSGYDMFGMKKVACGLVRYNINHFSAQRMTMN